MVYTGIGSRQTPKPVLDSMEFMAGVLATHGYTLRSGKAGGADSAFQKGAVENNGKMEIYIPWPGFNRNCDPKWNNNDIIGVSHDTLRIAENLHPAWRLCSPGARKLHARNVCQILGKDLNAPSDFVIFYSKADHNGKLKGGTATAVNLAVNSGIAVYNLAELNPEKVLNDILNLENN